MERLHIRWFSVTEKMASRLMIELSVVGFEYNDVAEAIEKRPQWNVSLPIAPGYGSTPLCLSKLLTSMAQ